MHMEKRQDIYFQRINEADHRLPYFVNECSTRGIKNNSSIDAIQFQKYKNSAFFAGIQDEKIKIFSGVHEMCLNNELYWRLGFRGVSLYDEKLKPIISKNWRVSGFNMGINFTLEMLWVEQHFGPSRFVMTSNDNKRSPASGKSHKVDATAKNNHLSGCSLLFDNIMIANVVQNVWELDKTIWFKDFNTYHRKNYLFDKELQELIDKHLVI